MSFEKLANFCYPKSPTTYFKTKKRLTTYLNEKNASNQKLANCSLKARKKFKKLKKRMVGI
ncbi:hypothetical protein BB465_00930 [Helicobacter pylori]|nr:hypothetical protein BB465_00930 [Helicobacter pylori]